MLIFFIYIPLCLYFNDTIRQQVFAEIEIYIPLCLYFNYTAASGSWSITEEFTFHYVSILIRTTSAYDNSFFIYIPLCLYFNPSSPSLFIFFLFHPLSVDLSIAINILPYFSCFFYKIDGKCPIYRVF